MKRYAIARRNNYYRLLKKYLNDVDVIVFPAETSIQDAILNNSQHPASIYSYQSIIEMFDILYEFDDMKTFIKEHGELFL